MPKTAQLKRRQLTDLCTAVYYQVSVIISLYVFNVIQLQMFDETLVKSDALPAYGPRAILSAGHLGLVDFDM